MSEMPEDEGWDDRSDWLLNGLDGTQLAEEHRGMWSLLCQAYEEDTGLTAWDRDNPIVQRLRQQWGEPW